MYTSEFITSRLNTPLVVNLQLSMLKYCYGFQTQPGDGFMVALGKACSDKKVQEIDFGVEDIFEPTLSIVNGQVKVETPIMDTLLLSDVVVFRNVDCASIADRNALASFVTKHHKGVKIVVTYSDTTEIDPAFLYRTLI